MCTRRRGGYSDGNDDAVILAVKRSSALPLKRKHMTPDQHKQAGLLLEELQSLDHDLEWINASKNGAVKITLTACVGGCSGAFEKALSGWRNLRSGAFGCGGNDIAQQIASLAFQDIAGIRDHLAAQLLALGVEPPRRPRNRRTSD